MDRSKMKPIIFNTEMVKAILDGRKISTRRPIKTKHDLSEIKGWDKDPRVDLFSAYIKDKWGQEFDIYSPYQTGDILYVRETWGIAVDINENGYPSQPHMPLGTDLGYKNYVIYRASSEGWEWQDEDGSSTDKSYWKPSIHMPKDYARLFLRVTDVRIERVQDITDSEAIKEGIKDNSHRHSPRFQFTKLWDSIYGDFSENPWLWVIDFEVISNG